jgi:hypothetical protein
MRKSDENSWEFREYIPEPCEICGEADEYSERIHVCLDCMVELHDAGECVDGCEYCEREQDSLDYLDKTLDKGLRA